MRKHRIPAPDGWDACQRNDFSEPRLLHLLTHTIALNSLTSDTKFTLINSNLLKSWLPGLCCKNSHISWLLPHLFAAVSQSFLRSYLIPGFSLQFCKPNKTTLNFPGGPVIENLPPNAGDMGLIPDPGKFLPALGQLRQCATSTEDCIP